jgi:hypothetical protein
MIKRNNLLDKYSLEMLIKNQFGVCITTNVDNQILASYLSEWYRVSSIKNDLLPEIEAVISGNLPFTDVGADVVGLAYIEPETTKLMGSDVGYADMELPTKEFKEIVIKWLEFLESQEGNNL